MGMTPAMTATDFAEIHADILQQRKDSSVRIVTEGDFARFPQYAIPAATYGYLREWLGEDPVQGPNLAPFNRIQEKVNGPKLPPKM